MRLKYHWRAATERVANHQARCVLLFKELARLGIGLGVVDQLLDHGAQQVDLNRLQIRADGSVFGVLFRQRRQQRLQCQGDGLFVQLAQLIAGFTLPLRQAGELFVQALLQLGDIVVETLALGLG
ncbi:hypothetical protein D3C76_1472610 [compost metagenome]